MELITLVLLLASGLIFLWKAGEATVTYTQKLSALYKLDTFFLGFVLLAFSTGIPELAIAIQALWNNIPSLSVSDIIGSNFLDIALVLGLPIVLVKTIYIAKKDYLNTLLILGLNVALMSFIFLAKSLNKFHGIFFITTYLGSCWYLWESQKKGELLPKMIKGAYETTTEEPPKKNNFFLFSKLVFSLALVLLASKMCVFSVLKLTKIIGIAPEIIGATILAIGTSLPEITLSMVAVKKKDYALAIGNSFGSVLAQGALVLGILALSSPTPIPLHHIKWIAPFFYAAVVILGSGIILRRKINIIEGSLLLLLMVIFFIYSYATFLFR